MIRLLLIMLLLPATALALDSTDHALDENSYPNIHNIYQSCLYATKMAQKGDIRGFLHSYCAARLNGFVEGITLAGIFIHSETSSEAEELSKSKEIISAHFSTIFCHRPLTRWQQQYAAYMNKKYPIEFFYAMDFLNYIEELENTSDLEKEVVMQSSSNITILGFFNNQYRCN